MQITKSRTGPRNGWIVTIDGESYTTATLAKLLGLSHGVAGKHILTRSGEDFSQWVIDKLTIKELNLVGCTRIFRKDNQVCWTDAIVEALGCHNSHASRKLTDWEAGLIDCDELFRPYGIAKTTPVNMTAFRRDRLHVGPRKDINSIPSAGSWERENIPDRGEDYVVGVEVGNTGKSSSGGFITR